MILSSSFTDSSSISYVYETIGNDSRKSEKLFPLYNNSCFSTNEKIVSTDDFLAKSIIQVSYSYDEFVIVGIWIFRVTARSNSESISILIELSLNVALEILFSEVSSIDHSKIK